MTKHIQLACVLPKEMQEYVIICDGKMRGQEKRGKVRCAG
jgi:hypothetical protein